jgi:predicted adenylyl cyclase CyaB
MSNNLSAMPSPGGGLPTHVLRRNIELKARVDDVEHARQIAQQMATSRLGTQHQVDTYFHARQGRLKLRQIDGLSAVLIWYARPDQTQSKRSDYQLVPVSNPETLKLALRQALGVAVVVDKRREIYLWHNVRIHLDRVVGLGEFLEFEAVLQPHDDDALGHAQLDELMRAFALHPTDLVESSYSDLLSAGPPASQA